MKPLDEFLININQFAPTCPEPTAFWAIRQAAIDFCEATRSWRYEDEFNVTDQYAQGITTPFGSVLLDIEEVRFDGCALTRVTPAYLDARYHNWRDAEVASGPAYVTQTEMNTIRIFPVQDGAVKVSLWLKPAQDCDELPDYLSDQYRETIANGALGRILALPGKAFTNVQLAVAFSAAFAGKLDGLRTLGFKGQQRAPMRTKSSNF
jgi:hypothetical protein